MGGGGGGVCCVSCPPTPTPSTHMWSKVPGDPITVSSNLSRQSSTSVVLELLECKDVIVLNPHREIEQAYFAATSEFIQVGKCVFLYFSCLIFKDVIIDIREALKTLSVLLSVLSAIILEEHCYVLYVLLAHAVIIN